MMRAMLLRNRRKRGLKGEHGEETFCLADVPRPVPAPGEVLIAVRASSLNPIDNAFLHAPVSIGPDLPAILHGDVAGVVAEVGKGATGFEVGDEVFGCAGGFKGVKDGALAEYMAADERLVAAKPACLNFVEAAALPLAFITAWEGLCDRALVSEGQDVLIHGGAGGVGSTAIQIAKARGCHVTATVSTAEKARVATALGASRVVRYREEPTASLACRFDVVLDTVGGEVFETSVDAARTKGQVVSIAGGDGPPQVPPCLSPRRSRRKEQCSRLRGCVVESSVHSLCQHVAAIDHWRRARKHPQNSFPSWKLGRGGSAAAATRPEAFLFHTGWCRTRSLRERKSRRQNHIDQRPVR
eukprot:Polyplicarium_translucidae@DN217_c0_g1_i1.p1